MDLRKKALLASVWSLWGCVLLAPAVATADMEVVEVDCSVPMQAFMNPEVCRFGGTSESAPVVFVSTSRPTVAPVVVAQPQAQPLPQNVGGGQPQQQPPVPGQNAQGQNLGGGQQQLPGQNQGGQPQQQPPVPGQNVLGQNLGGGQQQLPGQNQGGQQQQRPPRVSPSPSTSSSSSSSTSSSPTPPPSQGPVLLPRPGVVPGHMALTGVIPSQNPVPSATSTTVVRQPQPAQASPRRMPMTVATTNQVSPSPQSPRPAQLPNVSPIPPASPSPSILTPRSSARDFVVSPSSDGSRPASPVAPVMSADQVEAQVAALSDMARQMDRFALQIANPQTAPEDRARLQQKGEELATRATDLFATLPGRSMSDWEAVYNPIERLSHAVDEAERRQSRAEQVPVETPPSSDVSPLLQVVAPAAVLPPVSATHVPPLVAPRPSAVVPSLPLSDVPPPQARKRVSFPPEIEGKEKVPARKRGNLDLAAWDVLKGDAAFREEDNAPLQREIARKEAESPILDENGEPLLRDVGPNSPRGEQAWHDMWSQGIELEGRGVVAGPPPRLGVYDESEYEVDAVPSVANNYVPILASGARPAVTPRTARANEAYAQALVRINNEKGFLKFVQDQMAQKGPREAYVAAARRLETIVSSVGARDRQGVRIAGMEKIREIVERGLAEEAVRDSRVWTERAVSYVDEHSSENPITVLDQLERLRAEEMAAVIPEGFVFSPALQQQVVERIQDPINELIGQQAQRIQDNVVDQQRVLARLSGIPLSGEPQGLFDTIEWVSTAVQAARARAAEEADSPRASMNEVDTAAQAVIDNLWALHENTNGAGDVSWLHDVLFPQPQEAQGGGEVSAQAPVDLPQAPQEEDMGQAGEEGLLTIGGRAFNEEGEEAPASGRSVESDGDVEMTQADFVRELQRAVSGLEDPTQTDESLRDALTSYVATIGVLEGQGVGVSGISPALARELEKTRATLAARLEASGEDASDLPKWQKALGGGADALTEGSQSARSVESDEDIVSRLAPRLPVGLEAPRGPSYEPGDEDEDADSYTDTERRLLHTGEIPSPMSPGEHGASQADLRRLEESRFLPDAEPEHISTEEIEAIWGLDLSSNTTGVGSSGASAAPADTTWMDFLYGPDMPVASESAVPPSSTLSPALAALAQQEAERPVVVVPTVIDEVVVPVSVSVQVSTPATSSVPEVSAASSSTTAPVSRKSVSFADQNTVMPDQVVGATLRPVSTDFVPKPILKVSALPPLSQSVAAVVQEEVTTDLLRSARAVADASALGDAAVLQSAQDMASLQVQRANAVLASSPKTGTLNDEERRAELRIAAEVARDVVDGTGGVVPRLALPREILGNVITEGRRQQIVAQYHMDDDDDDGWDIDYNSNTPRAAPVMNVSSNSREARELGYALRVFKEEKTLSVSREFLTVALDLARALRASGVQDLALEKQIKEAENALGIKAPAAGSSTVPVDEPGTPTSADMADVLDLGGDDEDEVDDDVLDAGAGSSSGGAPKRVGRGLFFNASENYTDRPLDNAHHVLAAAASRSRDVPLSPEDGNILLSAYNTLKYARAHNLLLTQAGEIKEKASEADAALISLEAEIKKHYNARPCVDSDEPGCVTLNGYYQLHEIS